MSNTQVGAIYQQIIADVIESSRVDFEEGGVDDSVLEALRKGWQTKLTQLDVAAFPWDPKPDPIVSVPNAPPPVSSNGVGYQHMNNQAIPQQHLQQVNNDGPRIKTEPGTENSSVHQYGNQIPSLLPTTTTAQQRAAAHLHNNYGPRAAASINAIQQGASHNQQGGPTMQQIQMMQQQQQQLQQQQQQQQQQLQQQQQQQQQLQQQQQQQLQQQQQQSQQQSAQHNKSGIIHEANYPTQQMTKQEYQSKNVSGDQDITNPEISRSQIDLGNAQTDGTNDDSNDRLNTIDIIKRSYAFNNNTNTTHRSQIDKLIRLKVQAMGTSAEGGGLMVPLRRVSKTIVNSRKSNGSLNGVITAQIDGGEDEEDDDDIKYEETDENAINSDLDDPDEGLNEDDEDDEGMGHIMLCMYDKVQRVKNKWKCVMKDGVLTVNNKEYVFHKASGEYEW